MIGLGLTILGWAGVLIARLIKAAVSRQREFLADASAVQFTRQNDGIANALKKIGGFEQHSYLQATDPEEVSHMLFAGGVASFASLFSTHPPIAERIKALDPSFQERDYPAVTADQIGETHVSMSRPQELQPDLLNSPVMKVPTLRAISPHRSVTRHQRMLYTPVNCGDRFRNCFMRQRIQPPALTC